MTLPVETDAIMDMPWALYDIAIPPGTYDLSVSNLVRSNYRDVLLTAVAIP